jgi:prefoldin subunit 5
MGIVVYPPYLQTTKDKTMEKPEPSYNDLLREIAELKKKLQKLEQENQELKNEVEGYEMENAGESW